MFLSTIKACAKDIQPFLVERRKKFIGHCLKRLSKQDVLAENICILEDGYGEHSSSGEVYKVKLSEVIPSCTCKDWKLKYWPCKHILAIFITYPESWNTMFNFYSTLPWFNIDHAVLERGNKEDISKADSSYKSKVIHCLK